MHTCFDAIPAIPAFRPTPREKVTTIIQEKILISCSLMNNPSPPTDPSKKPPQKIGIQERTRCRSIKVRSADVGGGVRTNGIVSAKQYFTLCWLRCQYLDVKCIRRTATVVAFPARSPGCLVYLSCLKIPLMVFQLLHDGHFSHFEMTPLWGCVCSSVFCCTEVAVSMVPLPPAAPACRLFLYSLLISSRDISGCSCQHCGIWRICSAVVALSSSA